MDFFHKRGGRRRRFSRAFTIILTTALIAFVLFLTHLKALSEAGVRLAGKQPPPAPPAPWEEFPFLKRYHGGVKSIVSRDVNKPEYPDPARELEIGKDAMQNQSLTTRSSKSVTEPFNPFSGSLGRTPHKQCFLDLNETLAVPALQMYRGVPEGMPDPVFGSYDIFGLENSGCFDRYGRLSPYGLGYSKKYGGTGTSLEGEGREEAMAGVWNDRLEIDFSNVNWGKVQEQCTQKNQARFKSQGKSRGHRFTAKPEEITAQGPDRAAEPTLVSRDALPQSVDKLSRSVVLIRTWLGYDYDAEDVLYLRALINELALQSGGEYTIHFLVHVKDDNLQIWADEDIYQQTLDSALPLEFRGMGTLWSERQMGLIYGGIADSMYRDLPIHGVYRSSYMPIQYFAHMHPEYDFFWNWEMDVRYIGHYYHLFDKLGSWARKQPRKGLWERNSRFYVPSEHGSWEEFSHMVRVQTEHGTSSRGNMYQKMTKDPKHPDDMQSKPEKPVWGPLRPISESDQFEVDKDLQPPTSHAEDKYVWGVGEEADFITLNPLFDPDQTTWLLAEDVTGYNTTDGLPPRRSAIVTTSRLSRRLLNTMHRETALARHSMFTEMWPGSCALHHGLKAVYAPHPVYIDRRWPTSYLAAIFNNGRNGASGGARTSVFGDREHNFLGTTWYYHAGFPGNLWKRWLGYRVDNDGGEEQEKAGEGRMCLPSMLLHPVKHVDMIYEPKDEAQSSTAEGDQAS
ncbi:hypothetical protein K461DRAFT_284538 [Myriangium duriaei CBS 260.36]|uniref:Major facilitator superfamily transporter n=1 Tax=Myriangium duriaei CBS 260.36 TaxID=1168546 RepID=A0A9P4J7R0_9PEZI|nr:hypothetical protein K461DRAFT_284538 [Myriangium duriaei CBS 260.36]